MTNPMCDAGRPATVWCVVLALALVAVPAAGPAAAAQRPRGAESPEALIERLTAASEAGDFGEIAACIAPEERAQMAVMMVAMTGMMVAFSQMGAGMAGEMAEGMAGAFSEDGEPSAEQRAEIEAAKAEAAAATAALESKYEAVLAEHGLTERFADDAPGPPEGSDPAAAAAALLAGVDDVALLEDLFGLLEEIGDEGEGLSASPVPEGGIEIVSVEGDRATASGGGETMEMVRIDGRWYLKPNQPAE